MFGFVWFCKAIFLYVLLCVYMYIVNRDFHGNLLSFTLFFSIYNEFCCFSYIYMFKVKQKISQSVYICPNMVWNSYQHHRLWECQLLDICVLPGTAQQLSSPWSRWTAALPTSTSLWWAAVSRARAPATSCGSVSDRTWVNSSGGLEPPTKSTPGKTWAF